MGKQIFIGLVVLLTIACSNKDGGMQVDIPDVTLTATDERLLNRKGLLLFEESPFSGTIEKRHPSGWVFAKVQYLDGKKEGKEVSWYQNGTKMSEETYSAGKRNGENLSWWSNGEMRFRVSYVDDRRHGEYKQWYANGIQCMEFNYDNGIKTGSQKAWEEDGRLYMNYVIKDGRQYGLVKELLCD